MKLVDLLNEIDMANVKPYTTTFNWYDLTIGYAATIQVDGHAITFYADPTESPDQSKFTNTWQFTFGAESKNETSYDGTTASVETSKIKTGEISYIRLLRTAFEALIDFIEEYRVSAIDITGFDSNAGKGIQKTRIYKSILDSNKLRLGQYGYTTLYNGNQIWLIKRPWGKIKSN